MTMKCQQKCNPDWLGANWLVGDESKETVWRNISLLHIFLTVHSQLPVGRGPPAANQGNPEIAFFRFKTKKWKIQSSDPRLQDRLKMMGDQQVGINYFIFFFFCFLDPIPKHTNRYNIIIKQTMHKLRTSKENLPIWRIWSIEGYTIYMQQCFYQKENIHQNTTTPCQGIPMCPTCSHNPWCPCFLVEMKETSWK